MTDRSHPEFEATASSWLQLLRRSLQRWRWGLLLLTLNLLWIPALFAQETLPPPPQAPASLDTDVLMPQIQNQDPVLPQGATPLSSPEIPRLQDSFTDSVETLDTTVGREIVIESLPETPITIEEPGAYRDREVPVVFQERSSNTTIRIIPGQGIRIERPRPAAPDTGVTLPLDPNLNALRYPLPYAVPITSGFGMRVHPITGNTEFHAGIDLGGSLGTPVLAALSGQTLTAAPSGGLGNTVALAHGGNVRTRYGHLSKIAVEPGQMVKQGEVIGYVGSTGLSTGPHLHFELWQTDGDGSWIAVDSSDRLQVAVSQLPR